MIDTAKGGTMHEDCTYSRFTKHWSCCAAYVTIDEADCDCYDNHAK